MKIGYQEKRVSCLVTIPGVTTLAVNIDPLKTSSGQYCWLNLRNKFAGQVPCSQDGSYRLELRVKYWIRPENLLVPLTRGLFFLQIKDELRTGKLRCDTLEQRKRLVAIVARADFKQADKCTFVKIWEDLIRKPMLNDKIKEDIEMFYRYLEAEEVSCEAAIQRALTLVSELRDYGVELHVASDSNVRKVGVGPMGVTLHCSGAARLRSFSYEALKRIETDEGKTTITFLNDDGTSTAVPVQMTSVTTADRLYRAVTEMRSFFNGREISADVLNLCSRSLVGTVFSVFKQDSTLGQQYVCDVTYSMLEAYDETRRHLYKHGVLDLMATSATAATTSEQDNEDANFCDICYERLPSASLKPCGHVICFECGNKMSVCPWCRATVDSVIPKKLG
ncbi:MYLIP-like protein [Mya arenaria]|uniref:MYLIP-like protein n=1 Tax=Mya arenaria TaxID=6604 RepID=A0ABY7EXX1_MYAAR|nr:MYLIP-like protein [Mya arenaria]